jgi:hypothetical protein
VNGLLSNSAAWQGGQMPWLKGSLPGAHVWPQPHQNSIGRDTLESPQKTMAPHLAHFSERITLHDAQMVVMGKLSAFSYQFSAVDPVAFFRRSHLTT